MSEELKVITKAKNLIEYIFVITEASPKKYRLTFVNRMHNLSLDVLSNLYWANNTRLDVKHADERLQYQKAAKHCIDMLCAISEIAKNQNCILHKQYSQICLQSAEVTALIYKWVKSDKLRLDSNNDG